VKAGSDSSARRQAPQRPSVRESPEWRVLPQTSQVVFMGARLSVPRGMPLWRRRFIAAFRLSIEFWGRPV